MLALQSECWNLGDVDDLNYKILDCCASLNYTHLVHYGLKWHLIGAPCSLTVCELNLKSQELRDIYMWPKRDWERVTPIRKAPPVHTLPERVMWVGIYIPHSCYHLCSVCVCMHIHHMGHYICWMYTVVMSNGKALCCELKTGHMKTSYYMWHPFTQQDKCKSIHL